MIDWVVGTSVTDAPFRTRYRRFRDLRRLIVKLARPLDPSPPFPRTSGVVLLDPVGVGEGTVRTKDVDAKEGQRRSHRPQVLHGRRQGLKVNDKTRSFEIITRTSTRNVLLRSIYRFIIFRVIDIIQNRYTV